MTIRYCVNYMDTPTMFDDFDDAVRELHRLATIDAETWTEKG